MDMVKLLGLYSMLTGLNGKRYRDMNKFLADPTMGSVSDELLRTSETSVILVWPDIKKTMLIYFTEFACACQFFSL